MNGSRITSATGPNVATYTEAAANGQITHSASCKDVSGNTIPGKY